MWNVRLLSCYTEDVRHWMTLSWVLSALFSSVIFRNNSTYRWALSGSVRLSPGFWLANVSLHLEGVSPPPGLVCAGHGLAACICGWTRLFLNTVSVFFTKYPGTCGHGLSNHLLPAGRSSSQLHSQLHCSHRPVGSSYRNWWWIIP